MEPDTGYGAAVARALQHSAARRPAPGSQGAPAQGIHESEWIWLLHDDCEPATDALEQLLSGASRSRSVAVLGPKLKDLSDRRVVREAGITTDRAGRRLTGVEPGEIDQGQHDGSLGLCWRSARPAVRPGPGEAGSAGQGGGHHRAHARPLRPDGPGLHDQRRPGPLAHPAHRQQRVQRRQITVTDTQVIALAAGVVLTAATAAFLRFTKLGTAMRAMANDREITATLGVPVRRVEAAAWLGCGVLAGIAYVAVHRGRKFDGWCIQGFVAGAAVVVAAAALAGPGIPAGAYLAAAAPALLIGMSIGRPGCFWAGWLYRATHRGPLGVWSSDRLWAAAGPPPNCWRRCPR